jgi:glutaredoxin
VWLRRAKPASADHDNRRGLFVARVLLYHAEGCHLCQRARAQLHALRDELDFELEEVDIGGDAELEANYREWLPVVEIDGARAFVFYLDDAAFRRRIAG